MGITYGDDFVEELIAAIQRQLDAPLERVPFRLIERPIRAFDIAFAFEDMSRWIREHSTSFTCPYDLAELRRWTAGELAEYLVDFTVRAHRALARDPEHATLMYEALRKSPCFAVHLAITLVVFFANLRGTSAATAYAHIMPLAVLLRVTEDRCATEDRDPPHPPVWGDEANVTVRFTHAQQRAVADFLRGLPPESVISAVLALQERIERVGRTLNDAEFSAVVAEIRRSVAFTTTPGGMPMA